MRPATATTTTLTITISHRARRSYLALSSIQRNLFATSCKCSSGHYSRSDFTGQGFTGVYEAGQPTGGPLGESSNIGAPRITPRVLKQHLDQFVVGQERAKKVLSVAVYNHYQRIQELQRRDEEEEELMAQRERRELGKRHPVEDEFPGQQPTVWATPPPASDPPDPTLGASSIFDTTPLTIDKSNILLLGPSGVGKTLMAKTLARVLEVPFSMSDCTPFTQAGYIGEDAEVCVQRLLAASNYDVARAERGIICLDEIDKIATAKVSHGKDVSGEGVQQALLKIIEGTTLQIQAKPERSNTGSGSGAAGGRGPGALPGGFPTNSPLGGGMGIGAQSGGKGEVFNVRTDNILFIFTGAFVGLHKQILDRISRGSIGFGAPVRESAASSSDPNSTILSKEDEALFRKNLPFYTPTPTPASAHSSNANAAEPEHFNTLDLLEPTDLQKYGLIPELVGRIPVSCALSALSIPLLIKVLTEPRNSLFAQYTQLFSFSNMELRITSGALSAIATSASTMGVGARGLRTVLERLLGEAMFELPGSGVKYCLITEAVAKREVGPVYLGREGKARFHALIAREEEEWEERRRMEEGEESEMERRARNNSEGGAPRTFEEYREKAKAGGFL
ncbi:P-loop containing nucleoside triphosphate hydrolase protein [Cryomyces antarcticus]